MNDNDIMSLEKAMFILRHGSAEGIHKYLEAIAVIENEINRQKAEIESLNELVVYNATCVSKLHAKQGELRAEAIKEFAKRLSDKIFPYGMPDNGNYGINAKAVKVAIDNLVKEMVGERE